MPTFAALRRDTPWTRLALLVLVAVAARALTIGSPVVHVDEPFYLTVAQAMAHGAIPYVDVWDRKPIGLFLLYWPAAVWGLPASLYVYQAMAGASVVATAWLVMRLAERGGWRIGAVPAALFYILWLDLGDGQGGQTPVFYNLLTAGAAMLTLRATTGRRRFGLAAMLLVGLAIQIKYTVVFEGIGFGLWLLWAEWRRRRLAGSAIVYGAVLCCLALLPTAAAAASYAAMGHLDAFVFANFVSIFHRGKDATGLLFEIVRDAIAILSPLGFAAAGWPVRGTTADERRAGLFLRAWLVVALAAFVGFGGWYNHYTLPVMLPGSIGAAALFERRRLSWWWVMLPLGAMFLVGQKVLLSERARRGTAAEFRLLANRVGRGRDGLFVYSGPVLLYPATGRPALTRYIFPSHLEFFREAGSIGVDQLEEIDRIFARHPAAVVMAPAIDDENPAIRARVMQRLRQDGYRVGPPVRLGRDDLLVYRRPTS